MIYVIGGVDINYSYNPFAKKSTDLWFKIDFLFSCLVLILSAQTIIKNNPLIISFPSVEINPLFPDKIGL